jgi:preprotein translocase subunit SecA
MELMDPRLARCEASLHRIEALATHARSVGDAELAATIAAVRARVAAGALLDTVLPDVFAVVAEAHARVTGELVTRQQLTAGAALQFGSVADIEDGAGEEVAILLAAVLGAVEGHGVHVLTVADHIARWLATRARSVCDLVGVRVGVLTPTMRLDTRKDTYLADITYGSAQEFAYDCLRDNLAWSVEDIVQRGQHRALVTDADVLLLDQCRTLPMISGPGPPRASSPEQCARLATALVSGRHYLMPEGRGAPALTDDGADLARTHLGVADIYDPNAAIITGIRTALRAKELYRRGREYDVVDGRIVRLDNDTGAPSGTLLDSDLRHALEAKEDLPISDPTVALAQISMRSYLRRYRHLSGISASVEEISEACDQLYGLGVVTVPPGRVSGRVDHDDRLFSTDAQRDDAVLADVLKRKEAGQPVVIGTVTTSAADHITAELTDIGVPVRLAVESDPDQVAAVLAGAGEAGAVTVLLSAACRGVETVVDGLAVLGIGRHRSRRHDEPLRGLAGRNGTSGECVFYVSVAELAAWDGQELPTDLPALPVEGLQNSFVTAEIAKEQRNADAAKLRTAVAFGGYDDVWRGQYETMGEYRSGILIAEDVSGEFQQILRDVIDGLIATHLTADNLPDRQAIESLLASATAFPLTVSAEDLVGATGPRIRDRIREGVVRAFRARTAELDERVGPGASPELQRQVVVTCVDKTWRAHLVTMDNLYEDVARRVGSPADTLAEFRVEAAAAYQAMWSQIWTESIGHFFHLDVRRAQ